MSKLRASGTPGRSKARHALFTRNVKSCNVGLQLSQRCARQSPCSFETQARTLAAAGRRPVG